MKIQYHNQIDHHHHHHKSLESDLYQSNLESLIIQWVPFVNDDVGVCGCSHWCQKSKNKQKYVRKKKTSVQIRWMRQWCKVWAYDFVSFRTWYRFEYKEKDKNGHKIFHLNCMFSKFLVILFYGHVMITPICQYQNGCIQMVLTHDVVHAVNDLERVVNLVVNWCNLYEKQLVHCLRLLQPSVIIVFARNTDKLWNPMTETMRIWYTAAVNRTLLVPIGKW